MKQRQEATSSSPDLTQSPPGRTHDLVQLPSSMLKAVTVSNVLKTLEFDFEESHSIDFESHSWTPKPFEEWRQLEEPNKTGSLWEVPESGQHAAGWGHRGVDNMYARLEMVKCDAVSRLYLDGEGRHNADLNHIQFAG